MSIARRGVMRRREFVNYVGTVAAWPLATQGQQPGPVRRIGALMSTNENDAEAPLRRRIFEQTLESAGWAPGRNVRIDVRWTAGDIDRMLDSTR